MIPTELDKIRQHLRRDPVLRPLVDELPYPDRRVHLSELYPALLRSIVGQQVSTKAAAAIYGRFLSSFDLDPADPLAVPSPRVLAKAPTEQLRQAGLSGSKANYVRNLAEYFVNHPTAHNDLVKLSDEALIKELCQIKGIGQWTVEMMLIFTLGRPDVLPLDDLAIYQSILELYDLPADTTKRKLKAQMTDLAEAWRPYRSHACLYLYAWRNQLRGKST